MHTLASPVSTELRMASADPLILLSYMEVQMMFISTIPSLFSAKQSPLDENHH
jgi:hypothetical protein